MSINSSETSVACLPKEITSYDLLKAAAVILMIIDHIGVYFYPDEVWFRIIGRLCVPIWFFLIGYARTTEISRFMWIGAFLLVFSSFVAGQYILPVNILFTLALARHWRDAMGTAALKNPETLRGMFLILALAALPSALLMDYGSLGFLFVVMGFMVRHWQETSQRIQSRYLYLYVFCAFVVFWMTQGGLRPEVNASQFFFLTFGLVGVAGGLLLFRPATYPFLTKILTPPVAFLVKLLGRRTLEIYVFHIILFRHTAMVMFPDRFSPFELKMIAEKVIAPIL